VTRVGLVYQPEDALSWTTQNWRSRLTPAGETRTCSYDQHPKNQNVHSPSR
jgi:hypothetical protein